MFYKQEMLGIIKHLLILSRYTRLKRFFATKGGRNTVQVFIILLSELYFLTSYCYRNDFYRDNLNLGFLFITT